MSRLIDKLHQLSAVVSQSMGFRAAVATSAKPKMLLIARLVQAGPAGVADYLGGADAGLLPVSKSSPAASSIREALEAVPDIPWGGWLGDAGREEVARVVEAGCDFIVFPLGTPLAVVQDSEVGKILEVETSLSDDLLAAVGELPIDAVLVRAEPGQFLTWHHLAQFQRCAGLLPQPLLVSLLPLSVAASELQAVWEAGVAGMVVEVGIEEPAGRLRELRQMMDKLDLPLSRKRDKPAALLPGVGVRAATVTSEPDEEE